MNEREKIRLKLNKKETEIQQLEEKLRTAKVYVQALIDVMKVLDEPFESSFSDSMLKPGSAVAKAREVILKRGQPVHITDILGALGKEMTRESRASLTSSLSSYVRKSEVFTRPAPNTFGLIEMGHTAAESEEAEPPTGFDVKRADIRHGTLEMVEYDSKTVGTKRRMQVNLPPRPPPPCR